MHVLQAEHHGWFYKWFQLLSSHNLAKLPELDFPILDVQFLIVNSADYGCYHFCVTFGIIIFLFFWIAEILVISLSLLQEAAMLPLVS